MALGFLKKAGMFAFDKGTDVLNRAANASTGGLVKFKGEENFSDEVKAVRGDINLLGEHVITWEGLKVLTENQLEIVNRLDRIESLLSKDKDKEEGDDAV